MHFNITAQILYLKFKENGYINNTKGVFLSLTIVTYDYYMYRFHL